MKKYHWRMISDHLCFLAIIRIFHLRKMKFWGQSAIVISTLHFFECLNHCAAAAAVREILICIWEVKYVGIQNGYYQAADEQKLYKRYLTRCWSLETKSKEQFQNNKAKVYEGE